LNGTHGTAGFGGAAAAPVFKAVATEALRILDVPKDVPEQEAPGRLLAQNQVLDDLAIADLGSDQPNILEDADEEEQAAQAAPALVAESQPAVQGGAAGTVPNFKGMTLRAVLMEAQARGIQVQPDGSGVARVQNPRPGSVLHQGERIRVRFVR
jgi:hypothetical protein